MNTLRYNLGLRTIFLSVIAASLSLFVVIRMNNSQPQTYAVSAMPIFIVGPSPTIVFEPKVVVSSQISPDGAMKLTMKITSNENGTKTYAFFISNGTEVNDRAVFSKTLDTGKSMTIPFNTWSPDNKYFFIQEHQEGGIIVMVFNDSNEPFDTGKTYLDVTDLFKKNNNGNNFSEATGWASESLIIINTTTQDNTKGPSYWFEVPSKAIIQLGEQF